MRDVFEPYRRDPIATKVEEAVDYLAIANVACQLNPEWGMLGGAVIEGNTHLARSYTCVENPEVPIGG